MTRDSKPLAGRRVVVTRAPEQAQPLIHCLESYGAEVLLLPTVSFIEPEETLVLDAALRSLDRIDWIVFTSANAVRFFAGRARALGVDLGSTQDRPRIAAIGPATGAAAQAEGMAVTYTAKTHRGESLADEMRSEIEGKRVLLPVSDLAKDDLAWMLREFAGQVIEAVTYKTVAPGVETPVPGGRIRGTEEPANQAAETHRRVKAGEFDAIAFASPSSFRNFAELVGPETMRGISESAKIAAIGPTTARAIRDDGWMVSIEAAEATSQGLAEAIAAHFEKESGVKSS